MDEQLKQRLVGAIVLVMAAVIFVPMLLDGPRELEREFHVRQYPHVPVNGYDGSVSGPHHRASQGQDARQDRPFTEGKGRALHPGPALPDESSATELSARRSERNVSSHASEPSDKAADALLRTVSSNRSDAEQEIEDASAPASSPQGWVVQMGSFAKQDNAIALRDRLQALGYQTFVEVVPYKSSSLTRVNIGPEAHQGAAQALSRKLKTNEELAGIVRPYSK